MDFGAFEESPPANTETKANDDFFADFNQPQPSDEQKKDDGFVAFEESKPSEEVKKDDEEKGDEEEIDDFNFDELGDIFGAEEDA